MKRIQIKSIVFVAFIMIVPTKVLSQKDFYLKLDRNVPGTTPKVFAPGVVCKDNYYVGYCAFDYVKSDFYFCASDADFGKSHLMKINAGDVTKIDTLFMGINKNWEGEPVFSPDGQKMFFTSIEPPKKNPWHGDIFYMDRTEQGWGQPQKLPLNTLKSEWHASLSKNGNIYFGSERETDRLKADIYFSKLVDGEYKEATRLPNINSEYNDCDPLIAPDESYLIFHSDRQGGQGEHDLYISFKKKGEWAQPINMGPMINSPGWEMAPCLTPDAKYLLFTRRAAFNTKEPSKIYWVSIDIIKEYKK
jgi:hypothetical protein